METFSWHFSGSARSVSPGDALRGQGHFPGAGGLTEKATDNRLPSLQRAHQAPPDRARPTQLFPGWAGSTWRKQSSCKVLLRNAPGDPQIPPPLPHAGTQGLPCLGQGSDLQLPSQAPSSPCQGHLTQCCSHSPSQISCTFAAFCFTCCPMSPRQTPPVTPPPPHQAPSSTAPIWPCQPGHASSSPCARLAPAPSPGCSSQACWERLKNLLAAQLHAQPWHWPPGSPMNLTAASRKEASGFSK